jgi:hypothetical protein
MQGKDVEKHPMPSAVNLQALKKGFVFYLNASGRYLVLREHLRDAVTKFVQQSVMDLKRENHEFKSHRDFQVNNLQPLHATHRSLEGLLGIYLILNKCRAF